MSYEDHHDPSLGETKEHPLIPKPSNGKYAAEVAAAQHQMQTLVETLVEKFAVDNAVTVQVVIKVDPLKPTKYHASTIYLKLG